MDTAQLNEIWEQIVLELQNDKDYMVFAVWIAQLEPFSFENNCLVMKTKKTMVKEWIERRYLNNITNTLYAIWKKDIQFHIIVEQDKAEEQSDIARGKKRGGGHIFRFVFPQSELYV